MRKMKVEIKRNVNSRSLLVAKEEDLIKNLNPKITGWKNYYSTKTNEKWMQALDWYIICTFTRWYNKKHQRRKHMSRVGFVRNSIYEKGLKKMAMECSKPLSPCKSDRYKDAAYLQMETGIRRPQRAERYRLHQIESYPRRGCRASEDTQVR